MDNRTQQEVEHRLKGAEGHIRGIMRMVEAERSCIEVVQQIQAVQGSLKKAQMLLLQQHLDLCLWSLDKQNPAEVQYLKKELAVIFEQR